MYKFSAPMPYNAEFINRLCNINTGVEKSKITTLYFALPANCKECTGFEQSRFITKTNTDFDFWKQLIIHCFNKGFDFIYLLNSPKILNPEFDNIDEHFEKLDNLLKKLFSIGCNKIRVCNPQLIGYLNKNYPNFELYLSTSSELKTINEYSNLFFMFPNIKEFVPSFDLNKNFKFIKNVKNKFKNINIEIMVNEGCIPDCPLRNSHNIFITEYKNKTINENFFNIDFFTQKCNKILCENIFEYLCKCNIIYPWEIEEYSKIGINNFKFVGRNNDKFATGEYLEYYSAYLKGIDNINNIQEFPIRYFNNYICTNEMINLCVYEVKKYLPDINYFKKCGHLCSSRCGIECKYCYKFAEKIQKVFEKKQKKLQKRNIPFCVINK